MFINARMGLKETANCVVSITCHPFWRTYREEQQHNIAAEARTQRCLMHISIFIYSNVESRINRQKRSVILSEGSLYRHTKKLHNTD